MKYQDYPEWLARCLENTLSAERLSTYREMAGGDLSVAIGLYRKNMALSEAFYSPLQQVEVIVRNAIHDRLTEGLSPYWYDTHPFRFPLGDMVLRAKQSVEEDGKAVVPGRVVAALPFGFWVGLLGRHYENDLWRPFIYKAFPLRPKGFVRREAHEALNAIRFLRNRIMHHEPIVQRDLGQEHERIMRLIGWICSDTAAWVRANSRFEQVMAEWD